MNQKRTKGFTLIELLAVIVILAIIALIAVPVILNIIDKANKSAFKDTAYGIVNAAELYFAEQQLEPNGMLEDVTITLPDTTNALELKGEVPEGEVEITKEGKIALAVQNGRYCITKGVDDEDITVIENYTTCELPKEKATLPIEWYAGSDVSNLTKLLDENGEVIAYKISDYAESIDKLKGVVAEFNMKNDSSTLTFTLSIESEEALLVPSIDGNSYNIGTIIIINQIPNNIIYGITFSEPGVYMMSEEVEYISFSIGGSLKPTVVIDENSIKWDGNISGLESVQSLSQEDIYYYKVSDEIPSENISDYVEVTLRDSSGASKTENVFSVGEGNSIGLLLECGAIILDDNTNFQGTPLTRGVWFFKQYFDDGTYTYVSDLTFNKQG